MDTLLQIYTLADKASIAQMVVAFFSALMLLLAYQSQLESSKLNRDIADLDQKAKRAEFMPVTNISAKSWIPIQPDSSGKGLEWHPDNNYVLSRIQFDIVKNGLFLKDVELEYDGYLNLQLKKPETGIFYPLNSKFYVRISYDFRKLKMVEETRDLWLLDNMIGAGGLRDSNYMLKIFYEDLLGNLYKHKIAIKDLEVVNNKGIEFTDKISST